MRWVVFHRAARRYASEGVWIDTCPLPFDQYLAEGPFDSAQRRTTALALVWMVLTTVLTVVALVLICERKGKVCHSGCCWWCSGSGGRWGVVVGPRHRA